MDKELDFNIEIPIERISGDHRIAFYNIVSGLLLQYFHTEKWDKEGYLNIAHVDAYYSIKSLRELYPNEFSEVMGDIMEDNQDWEIPDELLGIDPNQKSFFE